MKAQLLKDLQLLQTKADSFFTDAKESQSEHGAGYFYIARKINKMIGYVTGTSDAKPIQTLTELRKIVLDITKEYGDKICVEYQVSISVECDETGQINYSGELYGVSQIPGRDKYSNRFYSKKTFSLLVSEFTELLKLDAEARKDDNNLEKDITV